MKKKMYSIRKCVEKCNVFIHNHTSSTLLHNSGTLISFSALSIHILKEPLWFKFKSSAFHNLHKRWTKAFFSRKYNVQKLNVFHFRSILWRYRPIFSLFSHGIWPLIFSIKLFFLLEKCTQMFWATLNALLISFEGSNHSEKRTHQSVMLWKKSSALMKLWSV